MSRLSLRIKIDTLRIRLHQMYGEFASIGWLMLLVAFVIFLDRGIVILAGFLSLF